MVLSRLQNGYDVVVFVWWWEVLFAEDCVERLRGEGSQDPVRNRWGPILRPLVVCRIFEEPVTSAASLPSQ